jgi:integrase
VEYGRVTAKKTPLQGVGKLVQDTINDAEVRLKPNTITQYRLCLSKINNVFCNFEVHQVKTKHIAQFVHHFSDTPNMTNRALSLLKISFDRAVLYGMCEHNPARPVKRHSEHKRTRLMTDEEFEAISSYKNPALKVIMELCYYTAQRIDDVLSIKTSDISEVGIEFEQMKTGKRLIVKMNPSILAAIKSAKALHPSKVTPIYLLGQRNGKKRNYSGVRGLFNRAKKEANIEGVTLHDIRAKSITDAKKAGIDSMALGGHESESSHKRYLRSKEVDIVDGMYKS